jgi:hypothetical protein
VNVQQPPPPPVTPPSNSSAPFASGTPTVGQTVSTTNGNWSGTAPISYAVQWQLCNPNCADIPGATGSSYTLVPADVGGQILAIVTAKNDGGSAQAPSNALGPVGPSQAQVLAALSAALSPHGKNAKIGALLKHGGYTFTFTAPSAGVVAISWYFVPTGAHLTKAAKPVKLAAGHASFTQPGTGKVKVRLTRAGKRLLKHARRLKVTSKASFTPTASSGATERKSFKLRR